MNKIKCVECGTKKGLDELINKDLKKGLYQCTDCATDHLYNETDLFTQPQKQSRLKRIPKLFKFMFGMTIIFIMILLNVNAICTTCTDNVIMYYNFNNLTYGMTELTGNSPDAIDYGSLTETDTFLDGAINKSTVDNNQYIEVVNNASFNDLSTGFTISFFYNVGNFGGYGRVFSLGDGNIDIYRDNGGSTFVQRTGSLSTNIGLNNAEDWLITIVYTDNSNVTIYKNGSYHAHTNGDAGDLSTVSNLRIGKNSNGGGSDSSNGIWDEWLISDRPFTSDEVMDLYTDYTNGIRPDFTPDLIVTFPNKAPLNDTPITQDTVLYFNTTIESDCNISINGTHYTSKNNTNQQANFTLTTDINGYNFIDVICYYSGQTASGNSTYFIDDSLPTIDYINYIQDIDGLNYQLPNSTIDYNGKLNISISDNIMLWSFNFTIGNLSNDVVEYNNYTENLGVSTFNILDTIDIGLFSEGSQNGYLRECDGHTTQQIRDYNVVAIENGLDFEGIKIHSDSGIDYIDSIKEIDRYNFNMVFNRSVDEFEIEIESDYRKLNIVNNSPYTGHIIAGNNWLDFVNDKFKIVEVLNPTIYKITYKFQSIDGEKYDHVNFDSFGEINCIDYNFTFNVDLDTDEVNLTNQKNGITYNITDYLIINFTYIPYYHPQNPQNCTLNLNSIQNNTDISVTKNIQNEFNINITTGNYSYNISCLALHNHPPDYLEIHQKTSQTDTFTILLATTSTTTTTGDTTTTTQATQVVNTNLSNMAYLFILLFGWLVLLVLTVIYRPNGKTVQLFNTAQVLFGVVVGLTIMVNTIILGIGITFISLGVFLGLIIYNDI